MRNSHSLFKHPYALYMYTTLTRFKITHMCNKDNQMLHMSNFSFICIVSKLLFKL